MMSKKSKIILLFVFIMVVAAMIFNSNVIYAEINDEYPGIDAVPHEGVSKAFTDSTVIKMLANLVYAVGRFLEWIMGVIFKLLTGYSDFPWADKIVFNAVPLLDINFINPADYSFVSSIQGIIQGLYSTIMALAIGFFGAAVVTTAIKLVISSLAAEKAKYKKAVVDWLIGFVMIFCIHYFISFVFYLNEQLVTVASKIVTERFDDANKAAAEIRHGNIATKIINTARTKGYTYNDEKIADILEENPTILGAWISHIAVKGAEKEKGLYQVLTMDADEEEQYKNLAMIVKWAANKNISVTKLKKIRKENIWVTRYVENRMVVGEWSDVYIGAQAIHYDIVVSMFKGRVEYRDFINAIHKNVDEEQKYGQLKPSKDYELRLDVATYPEGDVYFLSDGYNEINRDEQFSVAYGPLVKFYWSKVIDDMIILKSASPTVNWKDDTTNDSKDSNNDAQVRIITDLASYFRDNAYDKTLYQKIGATDNKKTIYIQNMLMYAVLVGQSLILFIAYIKRLFYVIMLAMIAPIVVVVDFFQKFGK